MDQTALADLRREILAARNAGIVHVVARELMPGPWKSLRSWLDSALSEMGFRPLSSAWREISQTDAGGILTVLLRYDLAYGAEIMPARLAEDLATRLCAQFPETTRYFTNATWEVAPSGELEQPRSWSPLTDATFDSGVIAVTNDHLVIAWVEDED